MAALSGNDDRVDGRQCLVIIRHISNLSGFYRFCVLLLFIIHNYMPGNHRPSPCSSKFYTLIRYNINARNDVNRTSNRY